MNGEDQQSGEATPEGSGNGTAAILVRGATTDCSVKTATASYLVACYHVTTANDDMELGHSAWTVGRAATRGIGSQRKGRQKVTSRPAVGLCGETLSCVFIANSASSPPASAWDLPELKGSGPKRMPMSRQSARVTSPAANHTHAA